MTSPRLTNGQIVSELFISARTVDHHVERILKKLEVPTRGACPGSAREYSILTTPRCLPVNGQITAVLYADLMTHETTGTRRTMLVNGNEEVLVVRAESLALAEEISHRMVEVERLEDGALLLDVDPAWAGAIDAVLVNKGVRVSELRCAQAEHSSPANSLKPRCLHEG